MCIARTSSKITSSIQLPAVTSICISVKSQQSYLYIDKMKEGTRLKGTRGTCATDEWSVVVALLRWKSMVTVRRDDASARVHETMRAVISTVSRGREHNGCIGMRDTRLLRQLCRCILPMYQHRSFAPAMSLDPCSFVRPV